MSWSRERIEARTDPAPLVLYDPRFRIGFDADREYAAGGEVSAVVDVRATEGTNADMCALGPSFGASCYACPDDGYPSCLALAGFRWTAWPTDEGIDDTLPLCGADFTDTGAFPSYSFDLDCGEGWPCIGASVLLVAPLVRRRRARESS